MAGSTSVQPPRAPHATPSAAPTSSALGRLRICSSAICWVSSGDDRPASLADRVAGFGPAVAKCGPSSREVTLAHEMLDTILLFSLPASGKSETRTYMASLTPEQC